VFGALPFLAALRGEPRAQAALRGVNAAVVGLLLAALYRPMWTSAIMAPVDFALAITAFLVLAFWKWPPWLVVVLAAGRADCSDVEARHCERPASARFASFGRVCEAISPAGDCFVGYAASQ